MEAPNILYEMTFDCLTWDVIVTSMASASGPCVARASRNVQYLKHHERVVPDARCICIQESVTKRQLIAHGNGHLMNGMAPQGACGIMQVQKLGQAGVDVINVLSSWQQTCCCVIFLCDSKRHLALESLHRLWVTRPAKQLRMSALYSRLCLSKT